MTKEQFLQMERLCKEGWALLAKTGDRAKPEIFERFTNSCPACQLVQLSTVKTLFDCSLCPVDVWRRKALNGCVPCELEGSAYGDWRRTNWIMRKKILALRKQAALKISKHKWTFLPAHEKIPFNRIKKLLA
jgi:hypothetical protein